MKYVQQFIGTISIFCTIVFLLASCTKEFDPQLSKPSSSPKVDSISPGFAASKTLVVVKGGGLGDIRSIILDSGNVVASFNPNFNTENVIMFRIPDAAIPGEQNIVFTNSEGVQFSVPFKVLGLPVISSASGIDFSEGTQITLTGKNLDDVTRVFLHGSQDSATIISASPTSLVIQFPATTVSRAMLDIYNTAGVTTTTQEFVSVDNAYGIFKDALSDNIENWSWSINLNPSPNNVVTGTASMTAQYTGAWGGIQLHAKTPVPLNDYKYVTFWIKGADVDKVIDFNFNWANTQKLSVPANVWTYYKTDLSVFKGAGVSNLETFVMQIEGDPKTFSMDDIMLVK
jgi:hypothetical protein